MGSIENDKILPEEEINLINEISEGIDISDIGLFWQLTIKTIDDLRIVNDEEITLEMYVMQLLHLKGMKIPMNESTEQTIENSKPIKKFENEEDKFKENN